MTTSTGDPEAKPQARRRKGPRARSPSSQYFGRIEFYGGRYVIALPLGVADEQDLHSGDTVDVHIENLAVTP